MGSGLWGRLWGWGYGVRGVIGPWGGFRGRYLWGAVTYGAVIMGQCCHLWGRGHGAVVMGPCCQLWGSGYGAMAVGQWLWGSAVGYGAALWGSAVGQCCWLWGSAVGQCCGAALWGSAMGQRYGADLLQAEEDGSRPLHSVHPPRRHQRRLHDVPKVPIELRGDPMTPMTPMSPMSPMTPL